MIFHDQLRQGRRLWDQLNYKRELMQNQAKASPPTNTFFNHTDKKFFTTLPNIIKYNSHTLTNSKASSSCSASSSRKKRPATPIPFHQIIDLPFTRLGWQYPQTQLKLHQGMWYTLIISDAWEFQHSWNNQQASCDHALMSNFLTNCILRPKSQRLTSQVSTSISSQHLEDLADNRTNNSFFRNVFSSCR